MPIYTDIPFVQANDGVLDVMLVPPTSIVGWSIGFQVTRRFGGSSGIIQKYMASGFLGVSGITPINAGIGQFRVTINTNDTSGLSYGAYAAQALRLDSGFRTTLTEGFLVLTP